MATEATVVFVPGFMQPAEAWSAVAELLPERYPSVLLQHREHDLEGRLAEIAAAARARAVLCGVLARRSPRAQRRGARSGAPAAALVTVGAAAGIEDDGRARRAGAGRREAGSWIEDAADRRGRREWERQPLFADQPSPRRGPAAGPARAGPAELALPAAHGRPGGDGAGLGAAAGASTMPVLAIAGARDDRYAEPARADRARGPDGRAAVVEHAGHAAHLQRPDDGGRAR